MKNLVDKSIKFFGIGHPETKTIFDISDENERKDPRYRNLEIWKNRKMSLVFKYTIDNEPKEFEKVIRFNMPEKTEDEIRVFILGLIDAELKS